MAIWLECSNVTAEAHVMRPSTNDSSPLEVIKTKLQSRSLARASFLNVVRSTWRAEGYRGFFRGLVPLLSAVLPGRALYFSVYTFCKENAASYPVSSHIIHVSAAAAAGIISQTMLSPIYVVKTRLQVPPTCSLPLHPTLLNSFSQVQVAPLTGAQVDAALRNYSGPVDCARRMLKEEGLKSFYKGLSAGYLGVIETAIQFVLYEHIKERLTVRRQAAQILPTPEQAGSRPDVSSLDVLLASGFAKFSACLIAYPHELIRTRLREQKSIIGGDALQRPVPYKGLLHCGSTILRQEGFRGFYSGLGPHLLRVVPNTAIMFIVFEFLSQLRL
jgi:solute carrier family 25 protein 33/36